MVHRKPRPRHSKFPKHSKKDPEQQIHWRNLEALLDRCHGDTTLMCSYPIFVFNLFTPNITCSVHMLLVFVCFSGLSVFWSFLNASYKVVCLILPLSIQSSFYCHGLGSSCYPLIQCVKYPSPGVLNNPANLFIILLTVQDRGIVFCTLSSCFFCFHRLPFPTAAFIVSTVTSSKYLAVLEHSVLPPRLYYLLGTLALSCTPLQTKRKAYFSP